MRMSRSWLVLFLLLALLAAVAADRPVPAADGAVQSPAFPDLGPPPAPANNPTTPARVALGRHLFYDGRLAGPAYMACSACHQPRLAFTDGRRVAIGVTGQFHPRNTPGLANVGYLTVLTWAKPDETTLEHLSTIPLFGRDPIEMMADGLGAAGLRRLAYDANYQRLFAAAFPETGGAVNFVSIRLALAAFMRTLVSAGAPYDRFIADPGSGAMDAAARRGMALFMGDRLGCAACHVAPLFTDAAVALRFHNTGLYNLDGAGSLPAGNQGLIEHSGVAADMGRFRTPSLRNVAVTAPYMHDGSIATLGEVIDHYAAGGRAALTGPPSPLASPLVPGFFISDAEKADLIAFLQALTDEAFLADESIQTPFR